MVHFYSSIPPLVFVLTQSEGLTDLWTYPPLYGLGCARRPPGRSPVYPDFEMAAAT